ncbi:MAG: hypothetical protein EOP01_09910, partial [Propionibacteriaceae bacterium]
MTPPAAQHVEEQAALRLAAGRARAGELMPYLSDALYAVKAVPTTAIPTVGVDPRWRMYYNPEFLLTLDVAEVVGVWLHEVAHPLRRHHERFDALAEPQERHPLFNQAGDCAINDDLRAGVGELHAQRLGPGVDRRLRRADGHDVRRDAEVAAVGGQQLHGGGGGESRPPPRDDDLLA